MRSKNVLGLKATQAGKATDPGPEQNYALSVVDHVVGSQQGKPNQVVNSTEKAGTLFIIKKTRTRLSKPQLVYSY